MKPDFFDRSILARQLWAFRKEFLWVGLFSMIANVLMLTPTIYMLQLYGRVMKSGSELTLLSVTFSSSSSFMRLWLLPNGYVLACLYVAVCV